MAKASGSSRRFPVRVGDLLIAAVPALEERLLAERIRSGWREAVGPELARRTRPGGLRAGTLTVMVDNSPWLQELSMRSAEVLESVRARFGPAVTALRLSLSDPVPVATRPASRRATPPAAPRRLDPDETYADLPVARVHKDRSFEPPRRNYEMRLVSDIVGVESAILTASTSSPLK